MQRPHLDGKTFDEYPYVRPDMAVVTASFDKLLARFEQADTYLAQSRTLRRINALREAFWTMYNLCYIRHTLNTADAFYEKENTYFDENVPTFEALNTRYAKALLESPFRDALAKKFGTHLFVVSEMTQKTFKDIILEDLQRENALSTEYTKIKAQAQIEFEGRTYNLSNLYPLELSNERTRRRAAAEAKWAFFAHHAPAFERIYDDMVHLRHNMAKKLGFQNFVELGYARMQRCDYTPDMVANFRRQVREHIVPLAAELYERQRQRLGLEALHYYDEDYKFATGNPKPLGTPETIVAGAAQMYRELSPETDLFFQHMQDKHLMDLVNRDGKATGGYCTYLSGFQSPFIFSNFNGTSGDIDVLTHEAGHAFQVWQSRKQPVGDYFWPSSDAAEIHSMSMEFFTWPWMPLFFGNQTDKYYFMHLGNAVQFLPYGVAVDEFQHIVYENPDMTPEERNTAWRQLEKTYLPHRNYEGNAHLEAGRYWQKQNHIFNSPFYYIDYTLAQICAFQFWVADRKNHTKAWSRYLRLCKAGGSRSFLDLVALSGLQSPFSDGAVAGVVGEIRAFMDSVDDRGF